MPDAERLSRLTGCKLLIDQFLPRSDLAVATGGLGWGLRPPSAGSTSAGVQAGLSAGAEPLLRYP